MSAYAEILDRNGVESDEMVTVAGNNALNIAYAQKPLLRREVHSGHYSYLAFYIAKCLTSLPLQQAYTTIFSVAAYFLVSCRPHNTLISCHLHNGHRHNGII